MNLPVERADVKTVFVFRVNGDDANVAAARSDDFPVNEFFRVVITLLPFAPMD
jgi:hypothetical protein